MYITMSSESYKCPYCNSVEIIYDSYSGIYVCSKCGSVLERIVFYGLETRSFEQTLPRTSGSYTNRVHDRGVGSTEFDIPYWNKRKWSELSRVQKGVRVTRDQKIIEKALRLMNQYSKTLEVPNYVEETAACLLRKAVEGKNYKSKTLRNLALASIYFACKIHGIPVSAKQYMKQTELQSSAFWKALREINNAADQLNIRIKREQPESHVAFIVNKLSLSHSVEKLANKLVDSSRKIGIDIGRPCVGLAAAAVYLSSILMNERRTQIQVASSVGISDVSIRNRYSDIVSNIDITIYM